MAAINHIQYDVNLRKKSTGELQRLLYHDKINVCDSIETEYLRGYHITDINNDEDSFYVEVHVNNDQIDSAHYYVNPVYGDTEDQGPAGDNSAGGSKLKVIFENESLPAESNNIIPAEYSLLQNYPNPFNPTTQLEFGISKLGFVSLKVYDILGKEVKTLVNEIKPAGTYNIVFDGSSLSSGVYFYRLESAEFVDIKRMILVK